MEASSAPVLYLITLHNSQLQKNPKPKIKIKHMCLVCVCNDAAIQICQEQSVPGMEIEYLDIKSLPFLNTDLEVDCTYPAAVTAFRKKIDDADAILFSSPEYNFSVTGMRTNFSVT